MTIASILPSSTAAMHRPAPSLPQTAAVLCPRPAAAPAADAGPVWAHPTGRAVTLTGLLLSVIQRETPTQAVEADLVDGTRHITIVWLGRAQMLGLDAGRRIRITGRVGSEHTRPVMFNPRYELLGSSSEH